jgi:plastocyanin
MQIFISLLVALVLIGGGYFWYTSTQTPEDANDININLDADMPMNTGTPTNSQNSNGTQISVDGTVSTGTKEITVSSTGMAFNQKTLSVKKGDRVRVTFQNGGGTHDLRIDGYNVGTKVINGGQSETFEFVADKTGSFEYYCSVGNHREMGMKGTLTVTE